MVGMRGGLGGGNGLYLSVPKLFVGRMLSLC